MSELQEGPVRSALRAEADRLDVPPVPVDRLVSAGRAGVRARRRRIGLGVAVGLAAVVAGGTLAGQVDLTGSGQPIAPATDNRSPAPSPGRSEPPASVQDLPQGQPPALPHVEDGSLFINGSTLDMEIGNVGVAVGGDTVTVVYGSGDESGMPVYLVDEQSGAPTLLTDGAQGPPVVSVDGRLVAWQTSPQDGYATVTGWNVEDQKPMSNPVTFPFRPTCCDNPFELIGVDAEGRVYGEGGGRTWTAWGGLEGQPEAVDGVAGGHVTQVTADGLVVTTAATSKEDTPTLMVGELDPALSFRPNTTVQAHYGSVSPDGRLLAYLDGGQVLRIRDLDSGDERGVPLPADASVGELVWESEAAVLVEFRNPSNDTAAAWVRCSADGAGCEIAASFSGDYRLPRP